MQELSGYSAVVENCFAWRNPVPRKNVPQLELQTTPLGETLRAVADAKIKHQVSALDCRRRWSGDVHRIIFLNMMKELEVQNKLHKNGDLNNHLRAVAQASSSATTQHASD